MPLPVLIPIALGGMAYGTWHVKKLQDEYLKDLEQKTLYNKNPVNITDTFKFFANGFSISLDDRFIDTKFYAYYLYSLILVNQNLLIQLNDLVTKDKYLDYFKNSNKNWNEEYQLLKDNINSALNRYLCYETYFKYIFGIPYNERDVIKINEKLLPFDMLSNEQAVMLTTWIINPLFNGWFDFEGKDIPVIKCYNIPYVEKPICEFFTTNFTKPLDIQEVIINDRKHFQSRFDVIRPWVLYNQAILDRKVTQNLLNSFAGAFDQVTSTISGKNKLYTVQIGENVENAAKKLNEWGGKIESEFNSLKREWNQMFSNLPSSGEFLSEGLMAAGAIIGVYLAYQMFFNKKEKVSQ